MAWKLYNVLDLDDEFVSDIYELERRRAVESLLKDNLLLGTNVIYIPCDIYVA